MAVHENTSAITHWSAELARKLTAQRTHMREAVDAQRERLQSLELTLEERFTQLQANLARAHEAIATEGSTASTNLAALKREEARLLEQRKSLEALHASLEAAQLNTLAREEEFIATTKQQLADLHERELTLAKSQQELISSQMQAEAAKQASESKQAWLAEVEEELHTRESQLNALATQLHRQESELAARDERTRRQRIALARELKTRRRELLAELERQPAPCEPAVSASSSSVSRSADNSNLPLHLARLQEQLLHAQEQLAAEQAARQKLETELHLAPQSNQASADLQTRLELALAELREEKKRNQELRTQAASKPVMIAKPSLANNTLDWETRKQNLLAQLEQDYSDQNPAEKAERLSLQAIITQTDEALALKDAELQALREELMENSRLAGNASAAAADFQDVLDHDQRILQERENLRVLQEKVREQFKQAEVEISLERARLARERQEMEDKIQRLERQHGASLEPLKTNGLNRNQADKNKAEKPADNSSLSSRWLTRLGLKDKDAK